MRDKILRDITCCPWCKAPLGDDACTACGRTYKRNGSQLRFLEYVPETVDAQFQMETFTRSSLRGTMFAVGKKILSSEYQPVNHLASLLAEVKEGEVVVELGSGSRRLPGAINVELLPFANVDLVADISHTPLKDGIADYVILDSVIEHVPDPAQVISEAHRILKVGGKLLVNCPSVFPYHGYPAHYQNLTRDGLQQLLSSFSTCVVRPTFGPMTAWVNITSEIAGVIMGGERGIGYMAVKGIALLPIFWLKYLDYWIVRLDRSHRVAGMLCAVAIR